ncbi:hypothetical protein M514_02193 [Trichuris suis]|uniref:UBC core domain-containing protein n=1 Tax=Trichuris suis TaxID=68888 RepID=A0A085N9N5_9BILA|nr:hypothetical protein M513_02193 [Trichuris suis]KFD66181.1 hypothetical protein M514_02193 [Trichuris suis]KHJ47325.1 ubiquitin--protein ligase [Trichuris suis]
MSYAEKRLAKEYKNMLQEPIEGIEVHPSCPYDFFSWDCSIVGPKNTCYENSVLYARISFPKNYPFYPPEIIFISKTFHPNIFPDGRVCLDFLRRYGEVRRAREGVEEYWLPSITISGVLLSLLYLLEEPCVERPANAEAASLWESNRDLYNDRVKAMIRENAEMR